MHLVPTGSVLVLIRNGLMVSGTPLKCIGLLHTRNSFPLPLKLTFGASNGPGSTSSFDRTMK